MITSQEIVQIIERRQDKLDQWLQKKSNKTSLIKINKALKNYKNEYDESRKLSANISIITSKEEFLFVYSMMNEYLACFCHDLISDLYIRKLEKKLKNHSRK